MDQRQINIKKLVQMRIDPHLSQPKYSKIVYNHKTFHTKQSTLNKMTPNKIHIKHSQRPEIVSDEKIE